MHEAQRHEELVSALADGQLRGEEFARTVERVVRDEEALLTWHSYHLVGDVLRSGETIVGAQELAFLQRLKHGLAHEAPQVRGHAASDPLAAYPQSIKTEATKPPQDGAANDASFRWKVLAGVASMVAVAMIGWQLTEVQQGTTQLAQATQPRASPPMRAQSGPVVEVGSELQPMIRDPQLDALLAAHRQTGGNSALVMSAGFLRSATFEGAGR